MKGTLGLKKGSVPFRNDLETTLTTLTPEEVHELLDLTHISGPAWERWVLEVFLFLF